MSEIRFTKMSGAGNDFIVLGAETLARLPQDPADWARGICRRRVSVGADGVLVVEAGGSDRVRVRFFNPDGSETFCGNGSRCAARFAYLQGLAGDSMTLETASGDVPARIRERSVELELPPPVDRGTIELELSRRQVEGRSVLAGVPHVVVFVDNVSRAALGEWGPLVRNDSRFAPLGVNFNVAEFLDETRIALRTWERGVEGETLACGSGAVAVAHAARLRGAPQSLCLIPASGIELRVEIEGDPNLPSRASLAGDARVLFEAVLDAEALCDGLPTGLRSQRSRP